LKWIDTTKKSHRFMVVIAIFTVVIGLWQCLSYVPRLPAEYRVFYYNHTDSLPRGLYLRMPLRELQDGDYVVFEPTEAITMPFLLVSLKPCTVWLLRLCGTF